MLTWGGTHVEVGWINTPDALTLEIAIPSMCEHCSVTDAGWLGALQKELFQATCLIKVKY